jgi:hypothetical protein
MKLRFGIVFALLASLLWAHGAQATIALVAGQVVEGNAGFGTATLTLTLPNNPTTNDLVVVSIAFPASPGTISVKDSNNNVYTAATSTPFTASSGVYGTYYLVAPANATKSITLAGTTATGGFIVGWIAEFSGTATTTPLETVGTANFAGPGTAVNLPSVTTTNSGDLLIAFAQTFGAISTINSPWTVISSISAGGNSAASYFIQTTAGAQAINYTQTPSNSWDGFMTVFKAAAALPTCPRTRSTLGVGC